MGFQSLKIKTNPISMTLHLYQVFRLPIAFNKYSQHITSLWVTPLPPCRWNWWSSSIMTNLRQCSTPLLYCLSVTLSSPLMISQNMLSKCKILWPCLALHTAANSYFKKCSMQSLTYTPSFLTTTSMKFYSCPIHPLNQTMNPFFIANNTSTISQINMIADKTVFCSQWFACFSIKF